MKTTVAIGCALTAAVVAAAPHVDRQAVTFAQDASRTATIAYTLEDEPAVITVEVQTNTLDDAAGDWVTVPELCGFKGDVNKRVEVGPRTITWNPVEEWPGKAIRHGKVRALVTAWPTNNPPDVALIHLPTGDVSFFRSLDALPGGPSADVYKVNYLVMRRCHAAGVPFLMGAPKTEEGYNFLGGTYRLEEARMGTLSADYYLGIYEFTVGQYAALTSQTEQSLTEENRMPLAGKTWNQLRGNGSGDNDWPAKGHVVSDTSVMGQLRARVGNVLEFDLPTSSQWEFACRAGSQLPYVNGARYKDPTQPADPSPKYKRGCDAGWNSDNAGGVAHQVGSIEGMMETRNAWGFCDMQGNLAEFVLDHMSYNPADHDFEKGPAVGQDDSAHWISANQRMMRGGSFGRPTVCSRAACVCDWSPDTGAGDAPARCGFRVCMLALIR